MDMYSEDQLLMMPAGGVGVIYTPDMELVTPVEYAKRYYPSIVETLIARYNQASVITNGPTFDPSTGSPTSHDPVVTMLDVDGSETVVPAPSNNMLLYAAIAVGAFLLLKR